MKIEFIKRGAATRLILIFAGWSTGTEFYDDCIFEGWDTAVVSDYRNMSIPEIPSQYSTIYLFAYSLGVWAASHVKINAAVKVAVFGTQQPVSDNLGIHEAIFMGTANRLSEKSLFKFHLRMAGNRRTFESLSKKLPPHPDITYLKEELLSIAKESKEAHRKDFGWHRAYISTEDKIIPTENQKRFWINHSDTEVLYIDSPHAIEFDSIIKACIPNTFAIGRSFAKSLPTYSKNAVVQMEICHRIGEIISDEFLGMNKSFDSILEIGPGKGLLTKEWGKYLTPKEATYVDLYEMQNYGNAREENYFVMDAEQWLETSDDKYDLILSASTIQWLADPIRFLSDISKHLNPGGAAIISTFTKGNLHQLDALRPSPIIYHSVDEYASAGTLEIEHWERTLQFVSPREMLLHLKNTGVKPSTNDKCLTNGEPIKLSSLPTQLTYKPLIIKIRQS